MEQRYQAVLAVIGQGATVTEVAARFGVSRKTMHAPSVVRAALAHYLAAQGVLPPDHPDLIEPTPTRGPGLASQRKDTP